MRTRPRLVHVTTTDISLVLLLGAQLRAFASAGYEVIGVSAPGPYVPRLTGSGIEHIALRHATRSVAPTRDIRALLELRTLLRRLRPDIVHTHNPKPGVYGRVAARMTRVPVVVNTVHGLYAVPEDRWRRRAVVYGVERMAAACSDVELVQNEEDVATLLRLRVPESRVHLLGNGIDLDRFDPARVDRERRAACRTEFHATTADVVVGAVGRLVGEKGYRELFTAAESVRRKHPNVRFVVVGPADDAKADALGPDELARAERIGVHFTGGRDDMEDLYAAMDVYVLASHREGFPRSAMEAAAMGVPIVATDIRGCRQVVDDGMNGVLVPARDSSSLAQAIDELVADPDRRAAMSVAGRQKAMSDFDERRVIRRTLDVYDQLLGRRASRA